MTASARAFRAEQKKINNCRALRVEKCQDQQENSLKGLTTNYFTQLRTLKEEMGQVVKEY